MAFKNTLLNYLKPVVLTSVKFAQEIIGYRVLVAGTVLVGGKNAAVINVIVNNVGDEYHVLFQCQN